MKKKWKRLSKCVIAISLTLSMVLGTFGCYVLLEEVKAAETISLEEDNYHRVTLFDKGIGDGVNQNIEGTLGFDSYDGVMFSANFMFGTNSIFIYAVPFENGVRAWRGMYFYVEGGTVKLKFNGISGYSTYEIPDIKVGTTFNLKLTTDYVDYDSDQKTDDVKLGIWVNGVLNNNQYIYLKDYISHMNTEMIFIGSDGAIASDMVLADASYKLEGNGYLITTTGTAEVTKDGVAYAVTNNTLNEAGTYEIIKTQGYRTITQKVTLYKSTSDVPAVSYDYLGGDEVMPIAAYFGPYKKTVGNVTYDYVTDSIYKMIYDSGINLINHSTNDYLGDNKIVHQQLRLAQKYNLGMYVSDLRLSQTQKDSSGNIDVTKEYVNMGVEDVVKAIGQYSYYESFLGIQLWDEPYSDGYNTFASTIFYQSDKYQRKLDSYLGISTTLNSYSNLDGFLNLLPLGSKNNLSITNSVTDPAKIATAYDEYLETAIKGGNLKYLSYDKYICTSEGSTVSEAQDYFKALSVIRKKAADHDIPFWSYVPLGGDFGGRESDNKYNQTNTDALPTAAETYWQVHMPLAFGAKGIEYFMLVQPYYFSYDDSNDGTDCATESCNTTGDCGHGHDYNRCGLIGANGQPTQYYEVAQKVNNQIKAVDDVLMKSESKGVIAVGANAKNNTNGITGMISADAIGTINSIDIAETNDDGAIVGYFDYQGNDAFYVVNYDVENQQTITLQLSKCEDYRVVRDVTETVGTGATISLEIPAGEAALVVLEPVDRETEYVYYNDISAYRKRNASKNTAPTLEGYVFAGWYKEASDTSKAIPQTTVKGGAYAKFVDSDILHVKCQLPTGTTISSDADLRIITSVDSLAYRAVGFEVFIGNELEGRYTASNVHSALTATVGGKQETYEPGIFSGLSNYFRFVKLDNISQDVFEETFTIVPMWKTKDGTTVKGIEKTFVLKEVIDSMSEPEFY